MAAKVKERSTFVIDHKTIDYRALISDGLIFYHHWWYELPLQSLLSPSWLYHPHYEIVWCMLSLWCDVSMSQDSSESYYILHEPAIHTFITAYITVLSVSISYLLLHWIKKRGQSEQLPYTYTCLLHKD